MIEKLYTVEEVAELASVTGRTIRNYLKSGRLKGRKIGGQWRFPESEVQRLLTGGEAQNNEDTQDMPGQTGSAGVPGAGPQAVFDDMEDDYDDYEAEEYGNVSASPIYESARPLNSTGAGAASSAAGSYAEPASLPPPAEPPAQGAPQPAAAPGAAAQPGYPYPQAGQPEQQTAQQLPPPTHQQAYPGQGYAPPPVQPVYPQPTAAYPAPQAAPVYQPLPAGQPQYVATYPQQPVMHPAYPQPAPVYPQTAGQMPQQAGPVHSVASYTPPQPEIAPATMPQAGTAKTPEAPQTATTTPETGEKRSPAPSMPELSDVGRRVAQFASEVHDCSDGPQVCAMIDMYQSFASAKVTSQRIAEIAEQETEQGTPCQSFVEFDARYYIARYTLFGSSAFLNRCLTLIG